MGERKSKSSPYMIFIDEQVGRVKTYILDKVCNRKWLMFVEKYPARLGRQVPPRVDRAGGPAVDQPDGGPEEGLRGAGQG